MIRSEIEKQSLNLVQSFLSWKGLLSEESQDKFQHYDLVTENGIQIEVKARRFTNNQFLLYSKQGFIIEEVKYEFLEQVNGRYINTFQLESNGKSFDLLVIWKIGKEGVRMKGFEERILPSNTDFSGAYDRTKSVNYLHLADQRLYVRISDNWVEITEQTLKTLLEQ